ncbi:unnamed protein product [Ixodes pacificus]
MHRRYGAWNAPPVRLPLSAGNRGTACKDAVKTPVGDPLQEPYRRRHLTIHGLQRSGNVEFARKRVPLASEQRSIERQIARPSKTFGPTNLQEQAISLGHLVQCLDRWFSTANVLRTPPLVGKSDGGTPCTRQEAGH